MLTFFINYEKLHRSERIVSLVSKGNKVSILETVKKVQETEGQAEQVLAEAHRWAEEQLEQARKRREEILESAREDARRELEGIRKMIREEGRKEARATEEATKKETTRITALAERHASAAATRLVEAFISKYGKGAR